MFYASAAVPPHVLRSAQGALARARQEFCPQAGPTRVQFFNAEGALSKLYAERWGCRDWDHFEAGDGAASHVADDVLWLRAAGVDGDHVAALVSTVIFGLRPIN
jgi:hypothetical protein